MSHGFGRLIVLFERLGLAEAAATLHGALSRHFESDSFIQGLPETMERVRKALGDNGFKTAGELGAAMTPLEATDHALTKVHNALEALEAKRL
jgi:hypothetical protein